MHEDPDAALLINRDLGKLAKPAGDERVELGEVSLPVVVLVGHHQRERHDLLLHTGEETLAIGVRLVIAFDEAAVPGGEWPLRVDVNLRCVPGDQQAMTPGRAAFEIVEERKERDEAAVRELPSRKPVRQLGGLLSQQARYLTDTDPQVGTMQLLAGPANRRHGDQPSDPHHGDERRCSDAGDEGPHAKRLARQPRADEHGRHDDIRKPRRQRIAKEVPVHEHRAHDERRGDRHVGRSAPVPEPHARGRDEGQYVHTVVEPRLTAAFDHAEVKLGAVGFTTGKRQRRDRVLPQPLVRLDEREIRQQRQHDEATEHEQPDQPCAPIHRRRQQNGRDRRGTEIEAVVVAKQERHRDEDRRHDEPSMSGRPHPRIDGERHDRIEQRLWIPVGSWKGEHRHDARNHADRNRPRHLPSGDRHARGRQSEGQRGHQRLGQQRAPEHQLRAG